MDTETGDSLGCQGLQCLRQRLANPAACGAADLTLCFTRIVGEKGTERDRAADKREIALSAREAALAEREAALSVREKALAERMVAAQEILVAADERDALSDARDAMGDTRDQVLHRADVLATGETYRDERPAPRGPALDREHAKGDRAASRGDRIALTEGREAEEAVDGRP